MNANSRSRRALALSVAALLAVGGLVVGCGGDGEDTVTAPTATEETTTTTTDETTTTEDDGGDGAGGIDPADGNANQGQQIFASNCSSCHGATGGGAAAGPALQNPDLAEEQGDVIEQIVNGGGGMPSFGDQLSDQEIADVAAYVIEDISQR